METGRFRSQTLSLVLVWIGGFIICYGFAALRAAVFPLLFLLLMVPLPDVILDRIIHALQVGSTEGAYLIFQAVGTPVSRNGFLLSLPGVTIEVAKECSSIRSSIALFITCLLAAHMYLRSAWKIAVLLVLGLLLSVVKNAIRIATLTLLSIYVDPSFLTGRLHHEGGFVFFLLALLLIWPVLSGWRDRTSRASLYIQLREPPARLRTICLKATALSHRECRASASPPTALGIIRYPEGCLGRDLPLKVTVFFHLRPEITQLRLPKN